MIKPVGNAKPLTRSATKPIDKKWMLVRKNIGGFWIRRKNVEYLSGGISKKGISLLSKLAKTTTKGGVRVIILRNLYKCGRARKPDYAMYLQYWIPFK